MTQPNMKDFEGNNVTAEFDQADIEKNRIISGVAYLIVLFFLPLVVCPESRFGRFHANQALVLFITSIAGSIVLSIIPVIGWLLLPVFSLLILLLSILGLVNGLTGKAKELPVIGRFKLIK